LGPGIYVRAREARADQGDARSSFYFSVANYLKSPNLELAKITLTAISLHKTPLAYIREAKVKDIQGDFVQENPGYCSPSSSQFPNGRPTLDAITEHYLLCGPAPALWLTKPLIRASCLLDPIPSLLQLHSRVLGRVFRSAIEPRRRIWRICPTRRIVESSPPVVPFQIVVEALCIDVVDSLLGVSIRIFGF